MGGAICPNVVSRAALNRTPCGRFEHAVDAATRQKDVGAIDLEARGSRPESARGRR